MTDKQYELLKTMVEEGFRSVESSLLQFSNTEKTIEDYREVRKIIEEGGETEKPIPSFLISLPIGEKLRSNFDYIYKMTESGKRFAIVIDNNEDGYMSVTNDIRNISDALHTDHIIYLDSDRIWRYWDKERGFRTLHVTIENSDDPIAPPTLDIAVDIAAKRYICA
jgi:hypothetical protein